MSPANMGPNLFHHRRTVSWGTALCLAIGAILLGRAIRCFPYLLPNQLPGLFVHELGPALILAVAIGTATAITDCSG